MAHDGSAQQQAAHKTAAAAPRSNCDTYTLRDGFRTTPRCDVGIVKGLANYMLYLPGTTNERGQAPVADFTIPTAATVLC